MVDDKCRRRVLFVTCVLICAFLIVTCRLCIIHLKPDVVDFCRNNEKRIITEKSL